MSRNSGSFLSNHTSSNNDFGNITGQGHSRSWPRSRLRSHSLRSSLFHRRLRDRGDWPLELRSVDRASTSSSSFRRNQDAEEYIIPPEQDDPGQPALSSRAVPEPESNIFAAGALQTVQSTEFNAPFSKKSSVFYDSDITSSMSETGSEWFASKRKQLVSSSRKLKNSPGLKSRVSAFKDGFRRHVLRQKPIPPSKDGRQIGLDVFRHEPLIDERTAKQYISNSIRSSRYSLWSFFPKQLFAQFSKVANAYFLLVAILQMIPGLSTTGTYTTIVPLLIFVSISMGKEGIDDLRRYRLDKEENNRRAYVLKPTEEVADIINVDAVDTSPDEDPERRSIARPKQMWVDTKWVDVKVGDVIKLDRDDSVPADVVLLHAEDPNGIAYIETTALDGESNLKSKQPSTAVVEACSNADEIMKATSPSNPTPKRMHFVVEDPNVDLYKFDGNVTVNGKRFPLTNSEVVYRGSILRNTQFAYGMVIYTGEECKIRMNANHSPRIKAPALQTAVNRVVCMVVVFVVMLSVICTVAYAFWSRTAEAKAWYLAKAKVSYGPVWTSFLIMFNTMIPISLYVSLEIVKVAQIILMHNDIDMYDEETNTPIVARTSTINEELGQISYIFSDKTGTLTNNSMRFRQMSVAGTSWRHDTDLIEEAVHQAETAMANESSKNSKPRKSFAVNRRRSQAKGESQGGRVSNAGANSVEMAMAPKTSVDVESLVQEITTNNNAGSRRQSGRTADMLSQIHSNPDSPFAQNVKFFILGMALCHTSWPERNTSEDEGRNPSVRDVGGRDDLTPEIKYQAASPDEIALVLAAKELGYAVIDRQPAFLTIRINTGANTSSENMKAYYDETYEILDVIEFTSGRKRMSIIVRMPDGRICVFTKGADTTIASLLLLSGLASDSNQEIKRRTSIRKSQEASDVIRRNSSQIKRSTNDIWRQGSKSSRTRRPIREDTEPILQDREPSPPPEIRRLDYPPTNSMRSRHSQSLSKRSVSAITQPQRHSSDITSTLAPRRVSSGLLAPPRSSIHLAAPSPSGSNFSAMSFQRSSRLLSPDPARDFTLPNETVIFERCFQHLDDFANDGLRTLLYAYRFVDEHEYTNWRASFNEASTSLDNREQKIAEVAQKMEQNLELLGATAIEDKLQKGVPRTIDKLRRANIKLWMLTGDKRETAINIGNSCRLVKDYSTLVVLDNEKDNLEQKMFDMRRDIEQGVIAHSVVVVDGQTLSVIENDPTVNTQFFNLAVLVDSVICCRASPKQKAFLVRSIRKRVDKSITLAIGDGANDIAMIQEAHVGIGITGKEGMQAARISDYSIAQFRFLSKLLLVHGRWNYVRVCKYVLGTFWKETMFYLTQALYQKWNGYTGTSLYEPWGLSMFNTLFTSLAVIFLGIFEQDLAPATLLAVPELYNKGQRNLGFNIRLYIGWTFMAVSDAIVIYFTMLGLFGAAQITKDDGVFAMGFLTFSACVVVINMKLQCIEIYYRTYMAFIAAFLSIGGWWLWNIALSSQYNNNTVYNVRGNFLPRIGRSLPWWTTLLLAITAVLLFEIATIAIRKYIFSTDVDVWQELEKDPSVRERLEETSLAELHAGWKRPYWKVPSSEMTRQTEEDERERQVQELLETRGREGELANVEEEDRAGDAVHAEPLMGSMRESGDVARNGLT